MKPSFSISFGNQSAILQNRQQGSLPGKLSKISASNIWSQHRTGVSHVRLYRLQPHRFLGALRGFLP
ncbi:hypothetical protein QJS10_CPA05g01105 [Acorus calamus]|uniref:Uncharacterized protein n=1 Tax=Acorus calamus TaxID=4465 RepID=A0AAV9EYD6_ACOCL|nr:hypothetical protein QJS10_CPA05g01105 [Acorus calamus]